MVATIGIFDGVHIGHRKIISYVVKRAEDLNTKSAAITFDPHPFKVLHPQKAPKTIISLSHRIRLIEALGVDMLVVLKFTKRMAALAPRDFIKKYLVEKVNAKEVVVGSDFRFGAHKEGDIELLKTLGAEFGFSVTPINVLEIGGRCVSSSLIRALITRGDLEGASTLLGRRVSVLGTVVHGSKVGRVLGYPTANVNPHHEAIPPSGVYAVEVKYRDKLYGGVLNIGFKPTFGKSAEPVVEAHIFGLKKRHIYGEDLEIFFVKKLRDERHFHNKESLSNAIRQDVLNARRILK